MRPAKSTTRREFLEAAGATGVAGGLALNAQAAQPEVRRPKVAAVVTTYFYLSHAYHIVGRFLDGFNLYEGKETRLHRPASDVVSLFIEQTPDATDLGRAKAKKSNVRLSPTIEDALTLGTGKLAVDAVLLIGEHGDYPVNDKLQKLYPRYRFYRQILKVFKDAGRGVPVFNDKHLSHSTPEAAEMVETSSAMRFPLMAGSSLPVTWRLPDLEIPLGTPVRDALVASRGDIEVFGFHALETLQCMVERRDRKGKPQGVVAVTCLEGDAVWKAGEEGVWQPPLLGAALRRSHTLNPGDMRQNTKDYKAPSPAEAKTRFSHPLAFVVEYADGLKATALILNGHVDDTTFAANLGGPQPGVASTLVYLPAPPGARFFDPLVLRIDDFFRTGKPPYPAARTFVTGGILDAALESRVRGHARIETPGLAKVDYDAPADSGYIQTGVASEALNVVK